MLVNDHSAGQMIKTLRKSADRGSPGSEAMLKEGYVGSYMIGDTFGLKAMVKQSHLLSITVKAMSSPNAFRYNFGLVSLFFNTAEKPKSKTFPESAQARHLLDNCK
jgi:hypothetical protein